jgi:hypothetical protein
LKRRVALGIALLALASAVVFAQAKKPATQAPTPPAPTETTMSNDGAVPANLPPAERAAHKFNWIEVNGQRPRPNITPTQFTEEELNAWAASGAVKLPKGVHQVRFSGDNGVVTANANVNFDEVKEGRGSANPLLMMFSGTHEVKVMANAAGAGGRGTVNVTSVEIDGMVVPRLALEFFVEKYLKPKYPNVGLDNTFALPDRIDTANVGHATLTVVQK